MLMHLRMCFGNGKCFAGGDMYGCFEGAVDFLGFCRSTMASMFSVRTPTVQEVTSMYIHAIDTLPTPCIISVIMSFSSLCIYKQLESTHRMQHLRQGKSDITKGWSICVRPPTSTPHKKVTSKAVVIIVLHLGLKAKCLMCNA